MAAGGGVEPHMEADVRPTRGFTSDSAEKSHAGAWFGVGSGAWLRWRLVRGSCCYCYVYLYGDY